MGSLMSTSPFDRSARAARVVLLAAAALTAAALVTGLAGPARAAYQGSDGKIAFVRHGDIYVIKSDGSGLAKLAGGGHDAGPRWSPDGQRIAYLDDGNLWLMNANGSHKSQITDAAPHVSDSRPSWSPNGRYLAFVATRRHHRYGYLTRYDTVTGKFASFTDTIAPEGLIKVAARPAPVAWSVKLPGYPILFEGAAAQCKSPFRHCLDLLGLSSQSQYKNGFPSLEYGHKSATRFTDPDWQPSPSGDPTTAFLATQEKCPGGHCTPVGINFELSASPILPGAYQAVFAPLGDELTYVMKVRGKQEIFTANAGPGAPPGADPHLLTPGSQPDWQPTAPFPPG
jgi:hypothetical protein